MTKWKKVLAIIIALTLVFMVFSLASCSTSTELSSMQEQGSGENILSEHKTQKDIVESGTFIPISMERIDYHGYTMTQFIMYDPVTLVMWTYVEWADGGGLSPMYNLDGTMRRYLPEN